MRFNGTRLKELRVSRKWDQHRLAEAARAFPSGITQSQISRYENGQEPSGRNALALAHALGVSVESLFVDDDTNGRRDQDDEDESSMSDGDDLMAPLTRAIYEMVERQVERKLARMLAEAKA